jgi:hypothetical protein
MKIDLADPTAVLIATSQALESAGLQIATCGGLALAMFGEPRETKDADLAVAGINAADAEAVGDASRLIEETRFADFTP